MNKRELCKRWIAGCIEPSLFYVPVGIIKDKNGGGGDGEESCLGIRSYMNTGKIILFGGYQGILNFYYYDEKTIIRLYANTYEKDGRDFYLNDTLLCNSQDYSLTNSGRRSYCNCYNKYYAPIQQKGKHISMFIIDGKIGGAPPYYTSVFRKQVKNGESQISLNFDKKEFLFNDPVNVITDTETFPRGNVRYNWFVWYDFETGCIREWSCDSLHSQVSPIENPLIPNTGLLCNGEESGLAGTLNFANAIGNGEFDNNENTKILGQYLIE